MCPKADNNPEISQFDFWMNYCGFVSKLCQSEMLERAVITYKCLLHSLLLIIGY